METSHNTFEFFVHWLYHQRLPEANDHPKLHALWNSDNGEAAHMTSAIALYVFCETYDVPALKTSTLEYLIEVIEASIKDLPFDKDITYAYQNTPTDSRLCRVLADAFCCWASKKASQIWFVTARSRLYPQPL